MTVLERDYIKLAALYLDRFRADRAAAMAGDLREVREREEARVKELDRELFSLASELDDRTWGLR